MTSIEWLWEQIDGIIPYQDINTSQLFNGVLEQAKEMHKQEMLRFAEWYHISKDENKLDNGRFTNKEIIEQYYQETFKGGEIETFKKETLYTEEQVEKLMYWTAKMTLGVWHSCKSEAKIIDELESKIQSLKQPKKD